MPKYGKNTTLFQYNNLFKGYFEPAAIYKVKSNVKLNRKDSHIIDS